MEWYFTIRYPLQYLRLEPNRAFPGEKLYHGQLDSWLPHAALKRCASAQARNILPEPTQITIIIIYTCSFVLRVLLLCSTGTMDQSSCVMISPDRISPAMTSTRAKVGHPCPNSSLCQINIVLAWPLLKAVEQDSTHEDVPWVNEEYNYKYPFPSIANIAISFYQRNGPIWKCSSITWSYIHLIGLCAWSLPPFQVTPRFKCGS